jgi:2-hydroxy-6-oxonona-2,4-dienedioate hydrolase
MDDSVSQQGRAVPARGETPEAYVKRIGGLATVRRASFGDGEMVWRLWGDGPPLVLLHGGYGSWTHWIRNVLPLAEHFTVIAADLPSHGDSDALPKRPTREEVAQAVAMGLAEVVPRDRPFDLVGFSLGANLAAAVAATHGGKLGRAVLVGPGGLGVSSQEIRGLRKWRPDLPRDELDARHRNNLGVMMLCDDARVDDLAVHLQRENSLRTKFRIRRSVVNTVLCDYLPEMRAALRCIWGEQDVYSVGNRVKRLEIMRRTHPDLQFRIVPDAGHWVMYEQPAAFNAALLDVLGVGGE